VKDIQWWFDKYKAICDEHGIQPPDVWNMDETGFRIGIARDQLVPTQDPDKRQFLPAPENRESVRPRNNQPWIWLMRTQNWNPETSI